MFWEQNTSEAALLNKIAGDHSATVSAPEKKAALEAAIAKVQTELTASNSLINANASAQSYADQRERLSKSVDDMMATLTAAGFTGNTTVNGAPAISAQLAPISTSTTGSVDTNPVISNANGATIEDAAFNEAGYALIQTLIASLLVYGNSLKLTTLLELKQTLIIMLLFQ